MLSSDIGFVMKSWKENIYSLESYLASDDKMIVAFTRNRIIAPNEIYSATGEWDRQVNKVGTHNYDSIGNFFNIYYLRKMTYSHLEEIKVSEWSDLWSFKYVTTWLLSDWAYTSRTNQFPDFQI